MAINVVCPSCFARFSVSDQYAGKQGPCPKCKGVISIPKLEDQVIIHSSEHSEAGAVGAGGRHVLKTYKRQETRFQPLVFATVIGVVLVGLLIALVLRGVEGQPDWLVMSLAAMAIGPPLAWAGYTFLRDDEFEPYRGASLIIRVVACGMVYAGLWMLYLYLGEQLFGDKDYSTSLGMEIWQLLVLSAGVAAIGTFAAYVCFDLDPAVGFFHYALFLAVTIFLRLVVGLPALPGLGGS
jgi:Zn-finger nucleic acid-binding protein